MRGQTTLDFAIGIVIFLAVIVFVFSFVPGILEPFDVRGEADPAQSDRIANSLAHETLGSSEAPFVLDRFCTVAFFNDSRSSPPSECSYDETSFEDVFNLPATQSVNVTLVGNIDESNGESNTLCWTDETTAGAPDSEPGLDEIADCDGDDTLLASGDDPPDSGASTITARRVVSLHDESITLKVIVW